MSDKAYCFPTPLDVAGYERETRWGKSNPVELSKEIELMARAGVRIGIINHAQTTLDAMIEARSKVYKP